MAVGTCSQARRNSKTDWWEHCERIRSPLGKLVSYEMGKSLQEGFGEVQEMIDICDFAVGQSRQLYGLSMHSERPVIACTNNIIRWELLGSSLRLIFPLPCGAGMRCWRGSAGMFAFGSLRKKTPLCAVACQNIVSEVFKKNNVPDGVCSLVIGGREVGEWMANDTRIPLVSATGSTRMGKAVGAAVGARLGRSLLELGGNNAIIISKEADLDIAIVGSLFGAVGTAGQRCTTTRRLIIHEDVYDTGKERDWSLHMVNLRSGIPWMKCTMLVRWLTRTLWKCI